MPNHNPSGNNQHTQQDDRKGQQGGTRTDDPGTGSGSGKSGAGTGGAKDNPGNFANDHEKARESGRKGGQS